MRCCHIAAAAVVSMLGAGCDQSIDRLELAASPPTGCAADWLSSAGLACSFTQMAHQPAEGLLSSGVFTPREFEVDATNFDMRFVFEEVGVKLVGNIGVVPVAMYRGRDLASERESIQLVEMTGTGVIHVTAVDAGLNAVHSRHSLIFGELAPSQFYGRCTCLY